MDIDGSKRIFQRLGPSQGDNGSKQQKVCFNWRAGRCNRFPCPYLHRELPAPPPQTQASLTNGRPSSKRSHGYSYRGGVRRNTIFNKTWSRTQAHGDGNNTGVVTKTETVCTYWVQGSCKYGDKCRYLHSLLTQLEGHQKVDVSGMELPSDSDKLDSGSTEN